jgi:hypothetical protein
MKRLFSIALKDGIGDEVAEVIVAVFWASDAGRVGIRHWVWRRQTPVSRLVLSAWWHVLASGIGRACDVATDV